MFVLTCVYVCVCVGASGVVLLVPEVELASALQFTAVLSSTHTNGTTPVRTHTCNLSLSLSLSLSHTHTHTCIRMRTAHLCMGAEWTVFCDV